MVDEHLDICFITMIIVTTIIIILLYNKTSVNIIEPDFCCKWEKFSQVYTQLWN